MRSSPQAYDKYGKPAQGRFDGYKLVVVMFACYFLLFWALDGFKPHPTTFEKQK